MGLRRWLRERHLHGLNSVPETHIKVEAES